MESLCRPGDHNVSNDAPMRLSKDPSVILIVIHSHENHAAAIWKAEDVVEKRHCMKLSKLASRIVVVESEPVIQIFFQRPHGTCTQTHNVKISAKATFPDGNSAPMLVAARFLSHRRTPFRLLSLARQEPTGRGMIDRESRELPKALLCNRGRDLKPR